MLDGYHPGLVVDGADACCRTGGGIEPPVELAPAVKVHLAANGKAHAAGDDALIERRQQVNAQDAGSRLLCPRILRLLPAKLGAHHKAVVNRCGGERVNILVARKHQAVERGHRLGGAVGHYFFSHRLLAVDGLGDFDHRLRLELDDAGGVVDRATADAARVLEIARAVIAHADVGVHLAGIRLALLDLMVIILNQHVVGHLDRARLDLCLVEADIDVARAVAQRGFPLGGLRWADRVIDLDVETLLAAGVAGERNRPSAVIHCASPGAGDVTRAVVLRRLGRAVVCP